MKNLEATSKEILIELEKNPAFKKYVFAKNILRSLSNGVAIRTEDWEHLKHVQTIPAIKSQFIVGGKLFTDYFAEEILKNIQSQSPPSSPLPTR